MHSLRETIAQFRAAHKALGHFNVSDSNQLKAVAEAAKEAGLPALVGLSEGERNFFPLEHVRAIIDHYRSQGIELFLNADHTYSIEKVQQAIVAGCDSVIIDGAKLPFVQNAQTAAACVKYARASGRDVLVEGELGYIGQSSEVVDTLPAGAVATEAMMTKPEELKKFVDETGLDMAAPAVGNIHGIVRSGNPKLSIVRIKELAEAVSIPLVLHGGSGSSDEEFSGAVRAGIAIIHINTDLRLTYRHGIERSFAALPNEVAPYKLFTPAVEDMKSYLVQKMRLFAGIE
ncbi:MAG: class II fructose-bisphosphate aldolase [Patescibacteria group bacterium]|nr:class II fructose-bisphosphate aldolase [Patescibacteria group bacterium]